MEIKIKEVVNLNDLKAFIRFPEILYRNNPFRVPPLFINEYNNFRKDKNPAFEYCEAKYWLAYSANNLVGRIAGIINHLDNKKYNQKRMRFGWIDFYDDPDISEALLRTVEEWAKDKGITVVHGPLGFTDQDPVGMLVEGFEEIATMFTIYNYPYYSIHLERLNYKKDIDWLEFEITVPPKPDENITKIADFAMKRLNLKIPDAKKRKDLLPYARDAFHLLNDSHQHLYGVVPLSEKQIDNYIKEFFRFISPDFVPLVLDNNNKLVAFGIAIPSMAKALQKAKGRLFPFGIFYILKALRKNNRAELCLVAVEPSLQGKGVNAILIHRMNCSFNKWGIQKVESNPELENNRLIQGQWKYFERRQHKRLRGYIKYL
jgi:GNAT superfamily N-acetyltransferase